jgi:hypothetical protein
MGLDRAASREWFPCAENGVTCHAVRGDREVAAAFDLLEGLAI